MTVVLAVVSDLHIVSTIGLCPPLVNLDDGGCFSASREQRWVWSKWKRAWATIDQLAQEHQARIWTVMNGDVVDGDHHNTFQIITRNPADMMRLAIRVCEPIARRSERLFIIRGTESHVGGSGSWEEKIADDLGAVPDSARRTASWWHLMLDVEGVRFDIAHHTSGGRLPWTYTNAAGKITSILRDTYLASGRPLPDVAIRSHLHRFADSGRGRKPRAFITPAWQLASAYVQRFSPGALADIGMLAFVCRDGSYTFHELRYPPDAPHYWKEGVDGDTGN